MRNPFGGLNRNVILLGFVSFFTDASSEMIFPLVPIFVTSVLGAPASVVGLIEGVAEATANIIKMLTGMYSDKMGRRRPFVFWGYASSSVVKPFFALASVWPHVLFIRFLDRVGKGVRGSARDVMVADYTDDKSRGRAFGYRKMMDQGGAFVGPLIAFLLMPFLLAKYPVGDAYRVIFALSVVPAVVAVAILFAVKEKEGAARENKSWRPDFKSLSRRYKVNLFVALFFSLGTFNYAFFILRASDIGMPVALIPLVYMFYNFVYGAFAVPAGVLSDKVGRRPVIAAGYLIFGVTALGLGFVSSYALIAVFFATYGVYMAIVESVQRAYIADLAGSSIRGTALGLYQGAIGIAALPAGVIAGVLWDVTIAGVRATFIFSAAVSFAAVLLFIALSRGTTEDTPATGR
ncbi:Major Facilitator Superfamily protein [uncultured archaeon]|nr:Major Facilitator Superfamily protein [uncultured archaeon]